MISEYLKELGISHLYASPIMEAVPGSVHGYDVTDFSKIREEIGGESGFRALRKKLDEEGIGWIQDFVPNHMAMDTRNRYLWDVLEKGTKSEYAGLFDIDWNDPAFDHGKLCLPFLEKSYYTELKAGAFSPVQNNGMFLKYRDMPLPLSADSVEMLLGKDLFKRAAAYHHRSSTDKMDMGNGTGGRSKDEVITEVRKKLESASRDKDLVDKVISMQNYSMRHWSTTAWEINYRRFFAVNGLICLREEDSVVFEKVHKKILTLISSGEVDGLRIDHIDGLFDPWGYLKKLREITGQIYILVEKILEQDESLEPEWPVDGTSGYDFLGKITSIMCSEADLSELSSVYERFTGCEVDIIDLVYHTKLKTIDSLFPAVIETTSRTLLDAIRKRPYGRDLTLHTVKEGVREILANTPVYRTYLSYGVISPKDGITLKTILDASRGTRPELGGFYEAMELLTQGALEDRGAADAIQKLQQYMPAILAKSVEDTIFYTFNRLISMNDVGADPFDDSNSVEKLHEFNSTRSKEHPRSMNALSTHDTKLSEDIRARINVLSEIPAEWAEVIEHLHSKNPFLSGRSSQRNAPSRNEEYYIYQLLIGSYPFSQEDMDHYSERLLAHLIKSIREAGINTDWDHPDQRYESIYAEFVNSLIQSSHYDGFAKEFWDLQSLVSFHGFINSITQKILQMTSPGVPDTYQGTEIWNFNFVDPDNRRKVDFNKIVDMHTKVREEFAVNRDVVLSYIDQYSDGRIKLLITSLVLNLRKRHPELFVRGDYVPIRSVGPLKESVIAFSRSLGDTTVIVLVPRLTVSAGRMQLPAGMKVWAGTRIVIPESVTGKYEDILTGKIHRFDTNVAIEVGNILENVPFSILLSLKAENVD